MSNLQEHLNHPFYMNASNYREHIRIGQIMKGAEKYPKPYNPENYTPEQQIEHFMQENVDQGHYAYGLFVTIKKQEGYIEDLEEKIKKLEAEIERMKMWKE